MTGSTQTAPHYFEHINPCSGQVEESAFSFGGMTGGMIEGPGPEEAKKKKANRRKSVTATGSAQTADNVIRQEHSA